MKGYFEIEISVSGREWVCTWGNQKCYENRAAAVFDAVDLQDSYDAYCDWPPTRVRVVHVTPNSKTVERV